MKQPDPGPKSRRRRQCSSFKGAMRPSFSGCVLLFGIMYSVGPVAASKTLSLSSNEIVGGDDFQIYLVDPALNVDPLSRESVVLRVEANKRNEPIHDVILTETDSNTATFLGSVLVSQATPRLACRVLYPSCAHYGLRSPLYTLKLCWRGSAPYSIRTKLSILCRLRRLLTLFYLL